MITRWRVTRSLRALLRLSPIARASARTIDAAVMWLDDLRRDVPYALRGLRRNPGFALAAVMTLALGIGAASAIYSIVSRILLAPLPYPESARLVRLSERVPPPVAGRVVRPRSITHDEFREWKRRTTTLSPMVATLWDPQVMVSTPRGAARLSGGLASPEWFALLGVGAMLGRTLEPSDVAESRDVVVLSARVWRRHFGSDPNVIGSSTTLQSRLRRMMDGRPMEIVGVMPDGFEDPSAEMEFWAPMVVSAGDQSPGVQVMGRLRPGVTIAVAEQDATAIGTALRPAAGVGTAVQQRQIEVVPLKDRVVEHVTPALRILLAAVAVVLLIVCANVASLLLARGTTRHREMAVRLAIGAGHGRVIRQLLAESLVISLIGGLVGAALGALGIATIKALASVEAPGVFRLAFGGSLLPRLGEITVDSQVLTLAVGLSILTSALFGLAPALHLTRAGQLQATNARDASAATGESRLRSMLVVAQLVMATMLLVGSGLLAHSFVRLSRVHTGYDPSNVFAFQLVLPEDYPTARKTEVMEAIARRLRTTPGVEAVGFTTAGPLIGITNTVGYFVPPGRSADDIRESRDNPLLRSISHEYLPALGVRILEGRGFSARDDASAPWVALVNRAFARKHFGEASPVGITLMWHGPGNVGSAVPVQIAGVVDDLRLGRLDWAPAADIFIDYRQLLAIQERWGMPTVQRELVALGFMSFVARTSAEPATLGPVVAAAVRAADRNAGIDGMAPLEQLMSESLARPRFYAVLMGLFAAVAGLLALVGVYGVMAYAVLRRTKEIGVRMALGAEPRAVVALVLGHGFAVTAIGVVVGLTGAIALSRYLSTLLFGITPLDPTTYVFVAVGFAAVALLAAYLPARRAMRVDPAVSLRCD